MNPINFRLAKVSLIRLGCPVELQTEMQNRMSGLPIVAVKNKKQLGMTASGYCPIRRLSGDSADGGNKFHDYL